MTVNELIKVLQTLRQDATVALQDNDGPCHNIENVITYDAVPDVVYLVAREE